jgi:hypothetical protein
VVQFLGPIISVIRSSKRAAEARVVGEGVLLPRGTHRAIHDERVGSKIEVLKVVEASKDADKELDQFVLGRVGAGALGERDGLQALKEAEMLSIFAEEDQPSMIGGQVEGRRGRGVEMGGCLVWLLRTGTRRGTDWTIDDRMCGE